MASGASSPPRLVSFTLGAWLVDPKACQMSRGDTLVRLRPQLVDLLLCLAKRAGEIVLKDEILAEVWPGQFIAESGLSRCVAELRQFLQDDVHQPRFIETIPKRGYRLVAPVVWLPKAAPETAIPDRAEPALKAPEAPAGGLEPVEAAIPVAAERAASTAAAAARRRTPILMGAALIALVVAIVAVVMLQRTPAKVLTEQDVVLLAFENRTGDTVFDDTIPLAVAIQLEQSPYLRLLSPGRIQETLRMMRRPPESAITRPVGMEICERVGAQALIVTSVASLGRQYAVGIESVACGTGRVLARRQVTTERKEQVLAGLQRAAVEIRQAVGEPAASLQRYSVPIVEATTASLEALRALRRGDLARERGQARVAEGFYRDAVTLDPNFALAHSRLGVADRGTGRVASMQKAYALRAGITLPERLEIEVVYHRHVTGEAARVLEAIELLARSYPRRAAARRDLAREYLEWGRYEEALAEAREALRLEPDSALTLALVARALVYTNRVAEGMQAAERGIALGPLATSAELHFAAFLCGISASDATVIARERAWALQYPDNPDFPDYEAEEAIKAGRLRDAIGFLEKMEGWAAGRKAQAPQEIGQFSDMAARIQLRMARYEALVGYADRAMRRVEAERGHNLRAMARIEAATVAITAGRFDAAERLLNEADREGLPGLLAQTLARTNRAAVAASHGRTREALDLLAPVQPYELGYRYGFEPLFARALVHYRAGDWVNATAAFEKVLAHPTIDMARKLLPHARLGLARTRARAGDPAGSRRAYEEFLKEWKDADPDLPLLLDARREYAALPQR